MSTDPQYEQIKEISLSKKSTEDGHWVLEKTYHSDEMNVLEYAPELTELVRTKKDIEIRKRVLEIAEKPIDILKDATDQNKR